MLGPFFEENAPKAYRLAPPAELANPSKFVQLEGQVGGRAAAVDEPGVQVLDAACRGIPGAVVEVWYAGSPAGICDPTPPWAVLGSCLSLQICPPGYSFPPAELWYRGKVVTGGAR